MDVGYLTDGHIRHHVVISFKKINTPPFFIQKMKVKTSALPKHQKWLSLYAHVHSKRFIHLGVRHTERRWTELLVSRS